MQAPLDATLIVTLVVMLVGLAGSVLPGLPGVPLIFLSALVYAYLTDFAFVGVGVLVLLGLLALLAFVSDFLATTYGVRRFGASNWGTVGGAVGGIVGALVGALFLGIGAIFGLLLGTVGGVFLGEYLRRRQSDRGGTRSEAGEAQPRVRSVSHGQEDDWRRTSRAAGGALVGMLVGAVAQAVLGVISFAIFVVALFV